MRIIILSLLAYISLNGCGGTYKVDVSGQVNQVVQVDMQTVGSYFTSMCEQLNVSNVTQCANNYTTSFWNAVLHTSTQGE